MRQTLALALGIAACGPSSSSTDVDSGLTDGSTVDAVPGQLLWTYSYVLQVEFAPSIAPDGTIVIQGKDTIQTPDDGPTVIALSPAGQLLWGAVTNPGAIPAPPVTIHEGTVYAPASLQGATAGTVRRFQLSDGAALGAIDLTGPITDGLAVAGDGTIYAPATPLQAVGDGGAWSYAMDGDGKTGSNAAVGPSGTIYVAGRGVDHNLHAVNPDGSQKWKRDLGAAVIDPIAIDEEERVYVLAANGNLIAYDSDGTLAWQYQLHSGSSGGGMIVGPDRTIYIGTIGPSPGNYTGEYLYAVRAGDGGQGELVWRKLAGMSWIPTTPALSANGTLYVTDFCRTLVALRASDAEVQWSYEIPDLPADTCAGFSAPRIGSDGTVYVWNEGMPGGAGAGLYALAGDGSGQAPSPWPQEGADPTHRGRVE